MAPLIQSRRLYNQTLTLIHKNLLIFFKSPIATFVKTLLLPIIITIIFVYLKEIQPDISSSNGITRTGQPVLDLADAIDSSSSKRLVFVINGMREKRLIDILENIRDSPDMKGRDFRILDDPNELYENCRQSIHGTSDCFASVMFTTFNATHVEYNIGIDEDVIKNTPYSYRPGQSALSRRVLPIQWALDSRIGGFSSTKKPTERMFSGYFDESGSSTTDVSGEVYWLSIVSYFAAPLFVFLLLVATYHISSFVAGERQNSVAELLMAQGVGTIPRILSNILSFCILYVPGVIISSLMLGELLFTRTSTGLIFILMLLACFSFVVSAHCMGSLFAKSSTAGLCTCILTFILGVVTVAQSMTSFRNPSEIAGLSFVFPSYAWATLIRDIATAEFTERGFPDMQAQEEDQAINGYLFLLFFSLQILIYGAGTLLVEHFRWGVPKQREWTESSNDVALRLGRLSKTFKRGKKAVNDLSFEVQKGSVTFLLGPNGSGKTTALKCISGMTKVDQGSKIQFSREGHSFGLCPQNNVLWDVLTVNEHVRIWAKLKTAGGDASVIKNADDVIAECDLTGKAHAASETLSGGQKRRLQLAIAFAGGSQVCCIDEASSGLDPLSRRNIWNIVQEGRRHRTTVLTTHFLDEADVLADHIVIMCKGSLVCQGSSTFLKSQYGDSYRIRMDDDDDDEIACKAATSAEATQKVLELERIRDGLACHITFPTLEQVFLKTTSEYGTAVNAIGGDGIVGEQEIPDDSTTAVEDKILAMESEYAGQDLSLDVGRSVGVFRQIWVLFRKRCQLLMQWSGLTVYAVNLVIPILVGVALTNAMYDWKALDTCENMYQRYEHPRGAEFPPLMEAMTPNIPMTTERVYAGVLGPQRLFSSDTQDILYLESFASMFSGSKSQTLKDRMLVNSQDDFEKAMFKSFGDIPFGIYAPTPDNAIFYHDASYYYAANGINAFSFLTNRLANSTADNQARLVSTTLRTFRHVQPVHDWRNMPISILIVVAFMAAVSTTAIYPMYERISKVRALQYSNGVSPFALWTAYLLFDFQFILVEALVVYGLLFVNPINDVWYRPDCIFGAFILFGIASYLGAYLISNMVRRGGFFAALGIHIVLFVLYFISYVANQYSGSVDSQQDIYDYLQAGLGLIAPAANLARALFVGMNTFDVLCGKFGDRYTAYPFDYDLYGGVYANLTYQCLFLIGCLALHEYGSTDWFGPLFFWRRRLPVRVHHRVDDTEMTSFESTRNIVGEERSQAVPENAILEVDRVSKHFGSSFATQNVSLSISANETLALLGGNGAGKTTTINMIRGELKPDYGNVYVNGISMSRQPGQARLNIGVCPQDDAVDNLTVRQTLEFYAAVKGLQRVKENVDEVMNALDITQYQKVAAKALSGGTKRKLTVAIALLGNPSLILLDEPSTAQDAGAKRILWRALKRIRTNRAILLTTHSMEEAEALASSVAIMRTRLLASGTLNSLNDSYGGAFRLRGVRCEDVGTEMAKHEVTRSFSKAGLHAMKYSDMKGLVEFFIKYEKRNLGQIMSIMEGLKGSTATMGSQAYAGSAGSSAPETKTMKVFEEYTLIEPTLEEVFMNVVQEAEASEGL
ncbi:uncharacterized protein KD926_006412 [Aspergillus affinis]|uniref:uncharacterized protein n=1 Tax=Aspergillus affinis TaxID=1070780 RepID=UPI0022FE7706|nr:uncharacterized protein KD926_006412 [Aspergillus affinis]KAI9041867.1 hypothetical protein KD926_006412 [Aspergillus affinis]